MFMGSVVLFICSVSCVVCSVGSDVKRVHVLYGLRMRLLFVSMSIECLFLICLSRCVLMLWSLPFCL